MYDVYWYCQMKKNEWLWKFWKKRGVVEKRGRRKRNPCPMRLCLGEEKGLPFCTIFLYKHNLFCMVLCKFLLISLIFVNCLSISCLFSSVILSNCNDSVLSIGLLGLSNAEIYAWMSVLNAATISSICSVSFFTFSKRAKVVFARIIYDAGSNLQCQCPSTRHARHKTESCSEQKYSNSKLLCIWQNCLEEISDITMSASGFWNGVSFSGLIWRGVGLEEYIPP